MNKVATTKITGGADYALVPDRLKAFREQNPRAKTETAPKIDGEMVIFKAHIVADKNDPNSPEATGHSYGPAKGNKAFEKLETVALGRALAQLGYLNNGEIATTEELDEFHEFKFRGDIKQAKDVKELMAIFAKMNTEQKKEYTDLLSNRKKEILNAKA